MLLQNKSLEVVFRCSSVILSLPVCVQMLGENAPSQLILYHYPDLKAEKGVVLMTAELDPKVIVSLAALTFLAHFPDHQVYGPVFSLPVATLLIKLLFPPPPNRLSIRLNAWPIRCNCSMGHRGRRHTDWSRHLTTVLQTSNTCQS